jgi:hypothetical protein
MYVISGHAWRLQVMLLLLLVEVLLLLQPHNSFDERERERATQRGRVLTSSVGLWEGPLGVRIAQCPYRSFDYGTRSASVPLSTAAASSGGAGHTGLSEGVQCEFSSDVWDG